MIVEPRRRLLILLALSPLVGCAIAPQRERKPSWAEPVQADGLQNLYRVDATLYRSAQPLPGSAESLRRLGIKTVIDLRAWHSDESVLGGSGVLNEKIPVHAWKILDRDVVSVLRVLTKKENGPFLLHCEQGADRTGLMVAIYRMVVQRWSREAAIEEMIYGGYGFHLIWQNIIDYAKRLDVEYLRAQIAT
jgi:protein tyrosine/serine phosphatase